MNYQQFLYSLLAKEKAEKEQSLIDLDLFNKAKECFVKISQWLKPLEDTGALSFIKENENKFTLRLKPTLKLDNSLEFLYDKKTFKINIWQNSHFVSHLHYCDNDFWTDSGEILNQSNFLDLLAKTLKLI